MDPHYSFPPSNNNNNNSNIRYIVSNEGRGVGGGGGGGGGRDLVESVGKSTSKLLADLGTNGREKSSTKIPDYSKEALAMKFPDYNIMDENDSDNNNDKSNMPFINFSKLSKGSWCLILLILFIHVLFFILIAADHYIVNKKFNLKDQFHKKPYADAKLATMVVSFTLLIIYVGVKYTIHKKQEDMEEKFKHMYKQHNELEEKYKHMYKQHNKSAELSTSYHKQLVEKEKERAKNFSNHSDHNSYAERNGHHGFRPSSENPTERDIIMLDDPSSIIAHASSSSSSSSSVVEGQNTKNLRQRNTGQTSSVLGGGGGGGVGVTTGTVLGHKSNPVFEAGEMEYSTEV